MLRKFSNSRTLSENIKLGVLTAFSAGMVNVASLLIFFSFTSNVTGHYAILAAEVAKGNMFQVAVVFGWILTFFFGSFTSNFIVINLNQRHAYIAHATPIILEILCLLSVGIYGEYFYTETLAETETMLFLMLFAMGLQNGLTASISNFTIKTTHLTGITTDLGILFSMLTQKRYRTPELIGKTQLLLSIITSYLAGAILAAFSYFKLEFKLFILVCLSLVLVIAYDLYELGVRHVRIISRNKKNRKAAVREFPRLKPIPNMKQEEHVHAI